MYKVNNRNTRTRCELERKLLFTFSHSITFELQNRLAFFCFRTERFREVYCLKHKTRYLLAKVATVGVI